MDGTASVHHRKVELQAHEDLDYLIDNVRRAAQARLDEAFPPDHGDGDDELRRQIEGFVNEVRPFFRQAALVFASLSQLATISRPCRQETAHN